MRWPRLRGVALAAVLGSVAGGVLGLYMRHRTPPVGEAGGAGGGPGLLAIGCPAGGGGWITVYCGADEEPYARARVPWEAYDDQVGAARPTPMRLRDGAGQQVVVALDAMPGQTGGWIVVLDGPEKRCQPIAWRNVVLGEAQGAETLWVAGGDVDGDGRDEVVVGGPQAKGEVLVLDDLAHGLAPLATLRVPWGEYRDGCGETRPAVGDLDGDGRAEVVVGLAGWHGRGGWVAAYKDLSFAKWMRFPDEAYGGDGGGTWPAVEWGEAGRGRLLLGTDGGSRPRIAALSDALGVVRSEWLDLPTEVAEASAELRPACADLGGDGQSHVLACADLGDSTAAALFDRASRGHAFLGWRRGVVAERHRGVSTNMDPFGNAREAALDALRGRCGQVEVSRGADGSVDGVFGELSAPSAQPPVDCAIAFLRDNAAIWGISDPAHDLALDVEGSVLTPDDCKTTQARFQQVVSGVPLLGGRLSVHLDEAGAVVAVTGLFDPFCAGSTLDTAPTVQKSEAVDAVKHDAGAGLVADPEPRLVAWRGAGTVRLCWEMETVSVQAARGKEYLVDALTGDIVRAEDCTMYDEVASPATGRSRTTLGHDVTLSIRRRVLSQDATGDAPPPPPRTTYEWVDARRAAHITTKIASGDSAGRNGETIGRMYFANDDQDLGQGGAWLGNWPADDPVHLEAAAAHRNLGKVLHYWYETRGRRGWDRHDGEVFLTLCPGDAGLRDRCAWLGQGWIAVGGRANAHTVTALDVLAHEFAHGVVRREIGAMVGGPPGAIGEHIADAFGEFTEYREKSETEDQGVDGSPAPPQRPGVWIAGSELGGSAHRDFTVCQGHDLFNYDYDDAPRNDAGGHTLNDDGNVHLNSGILNHWLYVWVHGEARHEMGGPTYNEQGTPGQSISGSVSSGVSGMIGARIYAEDGAFRCAERAYDRLVTRYGAGLRTFDGFRLRMLRAIADVTSRNSPAVIQAQGAFRAIHLWPPYRDGRQRITVPAPGSNLTSSSATFRWNAVADAMEYRISIGTTRGGSDIFHANVGTGLSADVSRIPTNGRAVWVRLWYRVAGAWYFRDEAYTAFDDSVPTITSPAPGSTLVSASVTFAWVAGRDCRRYRLLAGSSAGGSDLADSGVLTALSTAVTGLPRDGSTVYARLLYSHSTTEEDWRFIDATFAAARIGPPAGITSPAPGSTLISASATFTWTPAPDATSYRLRIGPEAGSDGWFSREVGANLSVAVTGLPTDGSTLYVQLLALYGTRWRSAVMTTYTAATSGENPAPAITSPTPGSTLRGSSVRFEWSAGAGVTNGAVAIGRAADGSDVSTWRSAGSDHRTSFSGIWIDGSPVYFWLRYTWGGIVRTTFAAYTAALDAPPTITSPAPGSTLRSSRVTLAWSAGANIGQFEVRVGSHRLQEDLFRGVVSDSFAVVTGLPTDGRTLHVELLFQRHGSWESSHVTYTAASDDGRGGPLAPSLTAPIPGSVLSSATETFSWDPVPGATQYWLQIGSYPGYRDVLDHDEGRTLSERVTVLPTDGRTLYARLYAVVGGAWYFSDEMFVAAGGAGVVTEPAPSSTLTGPNLRFAWSGSNDVRDFVLQIGSHVGGRDLCYRDVGTDQGLDVAGLPTDGSLLYVRLWRLAGSAWSFSDAIYTAALVAGSVRAPAITSPPPGTPLVRGQATFAWRRGGGETQYALRVASADGAHVYFEQATGGQTFANVTGLPTDGTTLSVRLSYSVAGTPRSIEATYPTVQSTGSGLDSAHFDPALACNYEVTARIVTSAGGRVVGPDGASVTLGAGSLSSDATVTLRRWGPDGHSDEPFCLCDVDLGGATLASPATLTMPIDDRGRVRGPDDAHVYQEDERTARWIALPVELSEDRRWMTVRVSHFSESIGVYRTELDETIEEREARHARVEPLQVPYYYQGRYEWCWAASFAMLEGYYGYQTKIWDVAYGARVGPGDGSGSPNNILKFVRSQSSPPTLDWKFFLRARSLKGYLMSQLDQGRPVWVGAFDAGFLTGHVVVAVGYDANTGVYVNDPSGTLIQYALGADAATQAEEGGRFAGYLIPWAGWERATGYDFRLNPFRAACFACPDYTIVLTPTQTTPKPVSVQILAPPRSTDTTYLASLVFRHMPMTRTGSRPSTSDVPFWWNGTLFPGHTCVHTGSPVPTVNGIVTASGRVCNSDKLEGIIPYLSNTSDSPTDIRVTVSFDRGAICSQTFSAIPAHTVNRASRMPINPPIDFVSTPVTPGFHELLIEASGGGVTDRALLPLEVAPAEVGNIVVQWKAGEVGRTVEVQWDANPEEEDHLANLLYIVTKTRRGGQPVEIARVPGHRIEHPMTSEDRLRYGFQVWAFDPASNLKSERAKPPSMGDWYVWTDSVGWVRAGTMAELDAVQQENIEIWGGSSTNRLVKTQFDGPFETIEEAQAQICAQFSQVTIEFNPLLTPSQWIRATLPDGRRMNVRLGRGNDPEVVLHIGQEYDRAEEIGTVKRNGITARMVFGHPQWLVHATGHGTIYGSVHDDFWLLIDVQPANGSFVIPDGQGGTFTYGYDQAEGPFSDSFALIPAMRSHHIDYLNVWGENRTVSLSEVPDGALVDHGSAVR